MQNSQQNSFFSWFTSFFTTLSTKKAISLFIILGLIVFGNALFNGFVWDDTLFILQNPGVHSINVIQLFSRNIFNSAGYYRPIPALYFALLYNIFGSVSFWYHLIQIAFHILNTVILYLTLHTLFSRFNIKESVETNKGVFNDLSGSQKIKYLRKYGSIEKTFYVMEPKIGLLTFFLSVIFLVHPINVESVSYIAASQSELFFLFGILALLISMKKNSSLMHWFFISGLLLLSLLTKETGFLFLLVILIAQYLFYEKRIFKPLIFEFTALAIYCFIRFAIAGVFLSKFVTVFPVPIADLSFFERLINIPRITLYYFTTVFFPSRLLIDQLWITTKITMQDFYLPLLMDGFIFIVICLVGIDFYIRKRNYFSTYLFFFLWFTLGIGMLLQIFPLDMTVSDRWFYFPLVGLIGMLGVVVQSFIFSSVKLRRTIIAVVLFIIIIVLLSFRTIVRNTNFHDKLTLYLHDSQLQNNPLLEASLGAYYVEAGNWKESLDHLQKSVSIYPFSGNLFYLGYFYESQGDLMKAQGYYYRSANAVDAYVKKYHVVSQIPQLNATYVNLARILIYYHENAAAEKISMKGLNYYPNSSALWMELAFIENKLQNQQWALVAIGKAKTFDQNDLIENFSTLVMNKQNIPFLLLSQYVDQQYPPGTLWEQ